MGGAMRYRLDNLKCTLVVVAICATWAGCVDLYSDPSLWAQGPVDTGGSGGTGGTGGTTTIAPGCMPSESPDPMRDDCGVFVSASAGSDDNDGSQAKPLATIGKALASPKSGPVYLCAESFEEAVQIKSGATIYGGLDCTQEERHQRL